MKNQKMINLSEKGKINQGYLIDHHTPPFGSLEDFDLNSWIKALETGQIECLMVYTKDHYGLAYYPSKVGPGHKTLKFDLIGEISKILKKKGLEFIAYYSVGFDNWAALNHDDWALRRIDGSKYRISRPPVPKWHSCCTQTGYTKYMIEQLTEIISWYNPDRIFLDITKHGGYSGYGQDNLPLCYCAACRKRFKNKYGINIPETDEDKEKYSTFIQDWEDNVLDYEAMKQLTDAIYKLSPDCLVSMNEMIHFKPKTRNLFNSFFSELSLGQWFTPLYARGFSRGREVLVGPVAQSTTFDPLPSSVYEYGTGCAVAQGAVAFEFSCQHHNGTADMLEFEYIGKANSELGKYKEYLAARKTIKDIAVLIHEESYADIPSRLNYRRALAALKYSDYTNRPVEVIIDEDLNNKTLSEYNILIIPTGGRIEREKADVIREFVKNGGVLVTCADISLRDKKQGYHKDFELADILGCHFERIEAKYINNEFGSYVAKTDNPLTKHILNTETPMSPPAYIVRLDKGRAVGTHILPIIVYKKDSWWNWSSPPPGEKTGWPAIVHNNYGRGHSIYFAGEVFEEISATQYCLGSIKFRWLKKFIPGILNELHPSPRIIADCKSPESVGFTYWLTDDYKKIIIHALNQTIRTMNGEVNPVGTGTIRLNADEYSITGAEIVYPEKKRLNFNKKDNFYIIPGQQVDIHTIISLYLK